MHHNNLSVHSLDGALVSRLWRLGGKLIEQRGAGSKAWCVLRSNEVGAFHRHSNKVGSGLGDLVEGTVDLLGERHSVTPPNGQ